MTHVDEAFGSGNLRNLCGDGKMRRAQMLDELTRAFEAKVTELVGGLSSASSIMEETAQSMSSTAIPASRWPSPGRRS